jgi:hypothetical protein
VPRHAGRRRVTTERLISSGSESRTFLSSLRVAAIAVYQRLRDHSAQIVDFATTVEILAAFIVDNKYFIKKEEKA